MTDSHTLLTVVFFLLGGALGAGGAVLWMRGKVASEAQLMDAFKALASDTLHANSTAFLQLAEGRLEQKKIAADASLQQKSSAFDEMVTPIRETLCKMETQIQALEVKREGAYRELAEMVTASREAQNLLRAETSQLLQALRAPSGRGRWGELQLQRLLEMTGMSTHVSDFSTQTTLRDGDDAIRPDVIVNLPGERCVVVDSKVPLSAYLDSVQAADEAGRGVALKAHARQVRDHIKRLAAKSYWEKFSNTPEFVVLFIPGEHFLLAALDADPDLLDYSVGQKVVLATPMTMVALLRTISYGWRQETLRENVLHIAEVGRKVHGALLSFAEQFSGIGKRLNQMTESYNKAASAFERKVVPEARRLGECGARSSDEEVLSPVLVEIAVREMASETDAA